MPSMLMLSCVSSSNHQLNKTLTLGSLNDVCGVTCEARHNLLPESYMDVHTSMTRLIVSIELSPTMCKFINQLSTMTRANVKLKS